MRIVIATDWTVGLAERIIDDTCLVEIAFKLCFRFDSVPCENDDGESGTCYLPDKCEEEGGIKTTECAKGYGVCCICK